MGDNSFCSWIERLQQDYLTSTMEPAYCLLKIDNLRGRFEPALLRTDRQNRGIPNKDAPYIANAKLY